MRHRFLIRAALYIFIHLAVILAAVSCPNRDSGERPSEVRVFAGSGLAAPLESTLAIYKSAEGAKVELITGDSDALAKSILAGEKCDLFIPDKPGTIDRLIQGDVISQENVKLLFIERLAVVVVREPGSSESLEGQNAVEFVRHARRIGVISQTYGGSAPFAKESLEYYGIEIEGGKIIELPSLQTTILYLGKGEIDCAVLFASEIAGDDETAIVDYLPPDSHTPYAYPLIILPGASDAAAEVAEFLVSIEARAGYMKFGYDRPDEYDRDLVEKNRENSGDESPESA